jgi:hypothetical protein
LQSCSEQKIAQPGYALFQLPPVDRVRQPDVLSRTVDAEVDARGESNTRAFEDLAAEPLAVVGEP